LNKRQKNSACNPVIHRVDPVHPDASIIREAARIIQAGGIIIFPTRTLYGLGVDANNPAAIRRLFQIKRRDPEKPISILIKSRKALASIVENIPPAAVPLMDRFWPGRITLIFQAIVGVFPMLTAGTGKIGIRIPEHPVAVSLVSALLHPITATSANYSKSPGVSRIKDLPEEFLNQIDLILDAGPLNGGIGSTVVDVTTDPPTVLREGTAKKKELFP